MLHFVVGILYYMIFFYLYKYFLRIIYTKNVLCFVDRSLNHYSYVSGGPLSIARATAQGKTGVVRSARRPHA